MDYKNTLNLPKTDFSMKANLGILEPKILKFWEDIDIYRLLLENRKNSKKFILHDGPPYANGLIHIGHALNKILKDIVIKFKMMQGYSCPFILGWDCHGLPVEHQLFKELNLTKHDVDVVDFRRKAKNFALKFIDLQKKDFKRLGVFADFDNPYLTMDPKYEYKVLELLEYLAEEGYIYRGLKPVNWCYNCETALAEAEVEYEEKISPSIYVKFRLKESPDTYFVIWTTTPWTLVSNVAIALNPNSLYCGLRNDKNEVLIVASKLREDFIKTTNLKDLELIWEKPAKVFENLIYKHPFLEREGKIILADFVSMQEGTGCVHIAPGHGEEDFLAGKEYNLDIIMPVDQKGRFIDSVEKFKGINVHEADKKIIEELKEKGFLIYVQEIQHSYPHCWRCKKPIIFRATYQWFINVEHNNLKKLCLDETERINWLPPAGKDRMQAMLKERPDWCVSRQRLWGVPIPSIKCKNCGEVILDREVLSKVKDFVLKETSDAWFIYDLDKFLPDDFKCKKCNKKDFVKEFDILDVWFESGASFSAVLEDKEELCFPADMYLEGSDQHRGWFQVSLLPSVAKNKKAPFKTVLTHGFVVDAKGMKMSKSKGNVISPQEIIQQYGAEILRLWTAYSDYSEDVKISKDILEQIVDIYRKIRNTIRFILGNLYDYDINTKIPYNELCEVDRYMLIRTNILYKDIVSFYENFSLYKVCQEIFNFCNITLSSFYLDILKDKLYTFSPNSKERRSAQFVLFYILKVLLKLISPILSFTAEEAYLSFFKDRKSVFLLSLDDEYNYYDKNLIEKYDKILKLREIVLKEIETIREKDIIGSSLEAEVFLYFEDDYDFYKDLDDILREIFIVSKVYIKRGEFKIEVVKSNYNKCARCWNYREEVGRDLEFKDLCSRCIKVIRGGEK